MTSSWGFGTVKLVNQRARSWFAIFFAAFVGLTISIVRSGKFEFFADDYVFLPLAGQSSNLVALAVTPLFGHFSPIAWSLHWVVANVPAPAVAAHLIMYSITTASSVLTAVILLKLTKNMWVGAIGALLVAGSEINVRTFNWWSAFAQDAPQVPLLLLTILLYWRLGEKERKSWLTLSSFMLVGTLNFLSYELAVLTPVFLYCSNVIRFGSYRIFGVKGTLQFAGFSALGLIGSSIFIASRVLTNAQTAEFDVVAFAKYFSAFLANSLAALASIPPIDSWAWTGFTLTVLALILFYFMNDSSVERIRLFFAAVTPYFLIIAVFAYARSGFESSEVYPGYPQDFQYHILTNAWLVVVILTLSTKYTGVATSARIGSFLATLLVASPLMFGADPGGKISLNLGQKILVSNIRDRLESLGPGEFVLNQQIPFVLPQFGAYSMLGSAVQVIEPALTNRVFSGVTPFVLDPTSGKFVLAFDLPWTTDTSQSGCYANTKVSGGWNTMTARARSGDYVLASLINKEEVSAEINAILETPDGLIETFPLGNIRSKSGVLGFEVPITPDSNRGTKSVTLVGMQILSTSKSEPCLRNFSIHSRG
jgi:hypothetical protein